MSGHNKWSKIKHKKAATDAAKSKIFGKMAQLIAVESKNCGGDVTSAGLATAIERAKAVSMPKDNIERAVSKGNSSDMGSFDAVTYEAYGPGGVAVIIEGLTDNRNKTAAEVRHALSKNGCELAASGSAAWAFTKTNDGYEPNSTTEIDEVTTEKLEKLVDALEELEEVQEVFTNAE